MIEEQSLDELLSGFLERTLNEIKGLIYTTTEDARPKHIGRFNYDHETDTLSLSILDSGFIGKIQGRPLSDNPDEYQHALVNPSPFQLESLFNVPSGYLAQLLARRYPEELTPNAKQWTSPEILKAMLFAGNDLSGGVMFFENEREMQKAFNQPLDEDVSYYIGDDDLNRIKAIQMQYQNLSASRQSNLGGAKPKFLANRVHADGTYDNVMIKYSVPGDLLFEEESRQLVLEHACLKALRLNGISAVDTRLIRDDVTGQIFFESVRADRSLRNSPAQHPAVNHWISAQAWHTARGGASSDPVHTVVRQLHANRQNNATINDDGKSIYRPQDTQALHDFITLVAFNYLVGNSDLHGGNLSLQHQGIDKNGEVIIGHSPAYDVEPYMLRTNEPVPEWAKNKNMADIQAADLPHGALLFGHNKMDFDRAKKIRTDMLGVVKELVKDNYLTERDIQKINHFFSGCGNRVAVSQTAKAPSRMEM